MKINFDNLNKRHCYFLNNINLTTRHRRVHATRRSMTFASIEPVSLKKDRWSFLDNKLKIAFLKIDIRHGSQRIYKREVETGYRSLSVKLKEYINKIVTEK